MSIQEFISSLETKHFSLSVKDGKLNLKGDKKKLSPREIDAIKGDQEIINFIKSNRDELIQYITLNSQTDPKKRTKDIVSIYRLSGLQEGMLFHGLYDNTLGVYIEQFGCDLHDVNVAVFKQSWATILKRHTILRSAFYYDSFSVPVQCVYREVEMPVEEIDYRDMNASEQQEAIKRYETLDRIRGFDFEVPPLMRLALIRVSNDRHRMLWTSHHILFDGWSWPILMEEFLTTYQLLLEGNEVAVEQEDRYEDYIRYLERGSKEKEEQYWRTNLKLLEQSTLLPFISRSQERTKGAGEHATESLLLDASVTAKIQQYVQASRITVNTLMQGVWAWLLHAYTGSNNVVYGVIVSGRPDDLPGVERRVGMYINTLPLHASVNPEQKAVEWLQALQEEQVASRQYQHTPLQAIQSWTGIKGDLFDSLLVFENYPVSKLVNSRTWSLRVENVRIDDQTNYPLTLLINSAEQINFQFNYNIEILKQEYVKEILAHFNHVLTQITGNEEIRSGDIKLVTPVEEKQLLNEFNSTEAAYPKQKSLVDLFEEQAEKIPEAVAVVYEDEQLSYRELNTKANQLAHYLQKSGVTSQMLVPICIERSLNMVVGILAILKAGGAYVPIDPEYPQERINYMLEDSGASVVLSIGLSRQKLANTSNLQIIDLDVDHATISNESKDNPDNKITPDQLVYVIYTSGSTGRPKGVKMPGGGLVNLLNWQEKQLSNKKRKVLQFASLTFDVSFQEIFSTLCFGSTLYLINADRRKDMSELLKDIRNYGITHLFIPYIVLKGLAENIDASVSLSLEEVIVAGEQLKLTDDIQVMLNQCGIRLINQYGPTEAHVVSSYKIINSETFSRLPPIGKPIDNTRLYVLDKYQKLCPIGIPGELYIGGVQVASGYQNRPELTAEKFIPDLFNESVGSRLYRTGDLCRWLPDGNIEYLGRIDNQVKVRGYRIELGEIESVLQQSGLISKAVVLAKEDGNGIKRLVAYVVSETEIDKLKLQQYLSDRLPEYMVPGLWVSIEAIPITPNGKVDRNALPEPDANEMQRNGYTAPRNEFQEKLAGIWQELLSVNRVGIYDNFFELGGHSLLAMRVISAIRRELKSELVIKDLFTYPTIAGLSDYLKLQAKVPVLSKIEVGPRPGRIPLSFSQERLWFIHQLEGSVQYHIPAVFRLKGNLNKEALKHAVQEIINRHAVLRTVYLEEEGQPYQYIKPASNWDISIVDGSVFKPDAKKLEQYVLQLTSLPFDLKNDNMLRTTLIELAEDEHILVIVMHHIASDGWSLSVAVKEVVELYESYVQKREAQLPVLPVQYADYAIWQRTYLTDEIVQAKLAYWKSKLENTPPMQLPLDFTRPALQSTHGDSLKFHIDRVLSDQLNALSQQQGATLFMTLLSAFNVLFSRYSGQEDICIGTPVANRNQQEIEPLIGFFLNTLALRTKVKGNVPFKELLQEVKISTLEAYAHQDVPFEKVVETVVKERDLSRSPLFQVLFVLQNTPDIPELRFGDALLLKESPDHNISKYDLAFTITETQHGLHGSVQYNTDLFREETIGQMLDHFKELLASIAGSADEHVSSLNMQPEAERLYLLDTVNNTSEPYPEDITIVNLFGQQAAQSPQAIALVYGSEKLTYGELDKRTNQLANYLQKNGVKAESLVPVCVERSLEMLIAMLGVLKAGAAYVPVDPDYPEARIQFMLNDTNAGIVLTTAKHHHRLKRISTGKLFSLDSQWTELEQYPTGNSAYQIGPSQLAYVLYTSGSTGRPKGVQVEHRSLASHLQWFNKQYNISSNDSSLLTSSFSFDGGLTAIWPVLLKGGTLHIPNYDFFDPLWVISYVADNAITYLKTLPGIFNAIVNADAFEKLDSFKTVRLILLGGEPVNAADLKNYMLRYPDIVFSNHYGPTECTISSSFYLVDENNIAEFSRQPLIGKPVANTKIYITDHRGGINPSGIPGEIWIAGLGVSRGYLNQPELTAEKFVSDPFSSIPGSKLYKTGDMGRWLPDGNIEFLGRIDEQVKVRGYRIEPGEIENTLTESGLVSQAAVIAKAENDGLNRLVAYVVTGGATNTQELIDYLKTRLPDYMIPALWLELKSLPLSPNGKTDKKALPHPDAGALLSDAYVAPRNETEETLVTIWKNLLKIERLGVNDNFFAIGGHSLLAIRVMAVVRKELNVDLSIRDLFVYATVSELAKHISSLSKGSLLPVITVQQRPEHTPLSFSQERLWFIDQLEGSTQYHLPAVLRLKGKLDSNALSHVLQTIINRHEVLRTVIREHDGQGYQYVQSADNWSLSLVEWNHSRESGADLYQYVQNLISVPFDLSKDYMLRAHLIRLDELEHVLVVTMHHIASDGWSTSILVKEVVEIYTAYTEKRQLQIAPLAIQYSDYAIWQRKYLQGELLESELEYWKQKLKDVTICELPADYVRPVERSSNGAVAEIKIEKDLLRDLQALSREQGATLYMTLLAAFKVLLYKYCGQSDICVGTVTAGRTQHEVENLIGFFVNTLALRTGIQENGSFTSLLQDVRTTTLEAFEHQDVPFEKVVEVVVSSRDSNRNTLFQGVFVLQNTPEVPELNLGDLVLSSQAYEHITAQFDYTIRIAESGDELIIRWEYKTDRYMPATIQRMLSHYKILLGAVAASPQERIIDLSILNLAERSLLSSFTSRKSDYPSEADIVSLFEEQVEKSPEAAALVFEEETLSYKELNERSNQLAHYLLERGVKPGNMVPLLMERSSALLISILGILKAGGAYVPVDPGYPAERIGFMLADTGAAIVLSVGCNHAHVPAGLALEVIETNGKDAQAIGAKPATNPGIALAPDALAYVIYTSGSTGKPKGVLVEHGNVVSLVIGVDYVNPKETDRLLVTGSPSFDATTFEYWSMLLNGGRLVLCAEEELLDSSQLKRHITEQKVTIMWFTSGWFNQLVESDLTIFDGLETILVGGEKLSERHIEKFKQQYPHVKLINGYGPTENTTFSVTYEITSLEGLITIPIGRTLSNRTAYILNEQQELVPVGVAGEICLGGAGLSRGYLNRPELTAEKFISNPYSTEPGSRLYRTGDLGRWLPDGNIEYLGRMDEQVKIRGYRIEPGEIESVLLESGMLAEAVVMTREDGRGGKRLVGYLVAKEVEEDRESIREYLSGKLPDYMIPQHWVWLDKLPLTANGKVDKKALPEADIQEQIAVGYAAPATALEQALAKIWQELLDIEQIGIHDDFFELGGHSLLAIRLISVIRKELKTEVAISKIFDCPTIASLAAEIESRPDDDIVLPEIKAIQPRPDNIPLSFSQERLWFIDQLEGSTHYHVPVVLNLYGNVNSEALQYALQQVVNRHEVLRTVIKEIDGTGYQYILEPDTWSMTRVDGKKHKDTAIYIKHLIQEPFDLTVDHMLRATLIKLKTDEQVLVVTLHHIASDGWSASILVKEIVELYESYSEHREARLEQLSIQYADYAIWQRTELEGKILDQKLAYWKEKLGGVEVLQLNTDYARPAIQTYKGASVNFSIESQLAAKLHALSNQQGATLFMTLLSAFKVLLYRYSRQQDICVGTPIANRTQTAVENLIGFFVNTLALRTEVTGSLSFVQLLQTVKNTTLQAYANQEIPFEKVVDAVVTNRDLDRNPLFQVMFILQNTPDVPELRLKDVSLVGETPASTVSKFDLTCTFVEVNGGFKGSFQYNTDLYREATISKMLIHFKELLNSIIEAPHQEVSALKFLTEEDMAVLQGFNSTEMAYDTRASLVSMFEAQTIATPGHTAIVFESKSLTYEQLNQAANRLAHYLAEQGVKAGNLVPVCMERGPGLFIGILGILKTGAAYVPVDPVYPQDRINYMLEDTGAKLVVSSRAGRASLAGMTRITVIETDGADALAISNRENNNIPVTIHAESIAYVIYTSGSTGRPKGVQITHGNASSFLWWCHKEFTASRFELVYATTSVCFDLSVFEIFYPLSVGKSLRILENGLAIGQYLDQDRDVLINTVPGVVAGLLSDGIDLSNVTVLNMAGEPVPQQIAENLDTERIEVRNLYGPTEDTTYSTVYRLRQNEPVLIGKPIGNTRVYIVQKGEALCPAGVPGEICLSGTGLAKGYLNRPELTAEKFVKNPFSNEKPYERLYKTGDLGRWLPDGNLEYLGRIDDQVKVRGYRIEPGEIENVLQQHDKISQAVVLAKDDGSGSKRLVGYVVTSESFDKQELENYLRSKLPDYMVPSVWVPLEKLPLTPNGKIDKKALPEPDTSGLAGSEYIAPATETEQKLAVIFGKLLGVDEIGVNDSFFELGGHSLLAMRAVSSIKKELNKELNIKDLFIRPTIADLSRHLDGAEQGSLPSILPATRPEHIPLSFSQERIWFIDQLEGSVQYNLPVVLRLKGELNQAALEHALKSMIHRHEVLRTVYLAAAGKPYQLVKSADAWRMSYVNGSLYQNQPEGLRALVLELIATPFNLSADYMLRASLIEINSKDYVMVVVKHHIAADAWSTPIIIREVTELYNAFNEKRSPNLPELLVQYADFAIWQREFGELKTWDKKTEYWKNKLDGVLPIQLPTDFSRPSVRTVNGASINVVVEKELSDQLVDLSKQENVTLYMTLLATFNVLLNRYSGDSDICVGASIANRPQQELENLIGFFVNTLALRNQVDGTLSFKDLLAQVKSTMLEAYEHQDLPFERVVEQVVKERDAALSPLFQVMLILLNMPETSKLGFSNVELSNEAFDIKISKVDFAFHLSLSAIGLNMLIVYNTDLFREDTMVRMAGHYIELLKSAVNNPNEIIDSLQMLTDEEEQQLLIEFNRMQQ